MVSIFKTSAARMPFGAMLRIDACRIIQQYRGNDGLASCAVPGLALRGQLSLNPPVDLRASKAPKLPDTYPANLTASCHALKRLRMDAKDSSCLDAIQQPFVSVFTQRENVVRRRGENHIWPRFTCPHGSNTHRRNGHGVSTSCPTVPQDALPSPRLLIYATIDKNYGRICAQDTQGTTTCPLASAFRTAIASGCANHPSHVGRCWVCPAAS